MDSASSNPDRSSEAATTPDATQTAQPADRERPDPSTLDAIFRPRSVAVIGASTRPGSIGREMVHNLIVGDFRGKLFPVNPKAEFIHSIKAYPSILDIPDPVDLAILVIPAAAVNAVADECGRKGVKGLVVVTAGFRETGEEGLAREEALRKIALRYKMRLVGPNCLGVFNADPAVSLNATFAPGIPGNGKVGFVSQSGALGIAIWTEMQNLGVGFSQFASIGNKVDVAGNALIEYWEDDPATQVIGLYIESFGDPRRFLGLARRVTRQKPIIMVKSGRTAAGARAASSHTGALAGLDNATDALLRQTGVIRARAIGDMLAMILGFTKCPLPEGPRVAILTNAGGPGIMATDALIGHGLSVAALPEETQAQLREKLPPEATTTNPVDMIAGATAENYGHCLKVLIECDEVDQIIVGFVPPVMINPMEVMRHIAESARGSKKPIFMVLMAEEHYYRRIPGEIPDAPPLYRYPEEAARTAAEMWNHVKWTRRDPGRIPVIDADRGAARRIVEEEGTPGEYLDPDAAFRLLGAYGFPLSPWRRVTTVEEAVTASNELGYPAVLKVAGRKIVHKSDVGGVVLGIRNPLEMEGAFARIRRAMEELGLDPAEEGCLVQHQETASREVILGMSTDPAIGPVLLFGLGGKYVEVMQDVTLRVHPITDVEAGEMVESIRGYALLTGVRGEESVALPVLHDALLRLSALVGDLPEVAEIDLNPFLVSPEADSCRIVDARIRIAGE
ncbi:MAG: acetate--CoA ligase family protein [Gemmatimonadota bacterium]|nr:acetate--CoA ligase family protein [Gemmatimonadota bacterium]MDP6802484.1 acetate--CoA ligase family protein [Gemmatimonadota bacterium]MDP7030959.1 acetate--CoA ligase family protein [Gemmatimonadota bacterium]